MAVDPVQLRAWVDYLRDLGVWEIYRRDGVPPTELISSYATTTPELQETAERPVLPAVTAASPARAPMPEPGATPRHVAAVALKPAAIRPATQVPVEVRESAGAAPELEETIPKPVPFDDLAPLPEVRVRPEDRAAALLQLRELIGDCTRCPLAYAGRRTIVFGNGDPRARLMFVGEGPGADEDASGEPFIGKAGQLLNNMIGAMGLSREQVYVANIVKCRPPQNRVPEPVEANTCSQFLLQQIDIVQPEVIVALGATAATYVLGVKQSLSSLRGEWKSCRGAKVAVTFHPAYLLRDPRQKAEAWKDLQRVMAVMGLKAPAKG